jgi:hypothetical protein
VIVGEIMSSQTPEQVMNNKTGTTLKSHSKDYGWAVFLLVIVTLMIAGYFAVSPQKLYKPGDDIGYNLGLVGGIDRKSVV